MKLNTFTKNINLKRDYLSFLFCFTLIICDCICLFFGFFCEICENVPLNSKTFSIYKTKTSGPIIFIAQLLIFNTNKYGDVLKYEDFFPKEIYIQLCYTPSLIFCSLMISRFIYK